MNLDEEDIEAVAQRVAQLLHERRPPQFVDAAHLARVLGVERDWVYTHAGQLGAVRLGGSGGRLRFDLHHATRALQPARTASRWDGRQRPRRTRSRLSSSDVQLIDYES